MSAIAVTRAEADAQSLANQYLMRTLGERYQAVDGFLGNHHWYFRMVYHCPDLSQKLGVSKLRVEAHTGVVIPLIDEQLEDARDQANEQSGKIQGIVVPTARRHIQGYLTNYVSLFAEPDRPIYVNGDPPLWRATVSLRPPGEGRVAI